MLIQFQVKNFGPIKDTQTLSMEASSDTDLEDYYVCKINKLRILKLAVIYGPNASGKTTILKALDFLRGLVTQAKVQKSEIIPFTPFLFNENSRNEPSWMRIIFLHATIKYDYEITFNQKCVLEEKLLYYPKGRKVVFFSRTTDIKNQLSSIHWGDSIKLPTKYKEIIDGNTLWNEPVLAAFNKSNVKSEALANVKDWFENYLYVMLIRHDPLFNWAFGMFEFSESNKVMMTQFMQQAGIQIDKMEVKTTETPIEAQAIEFIPTQNISQTNEGIVIQSEGKIKIPVKNMVKTEKELFFHHNIKNKDGLSATYPLSLSLQSHGTLQYYGLTALLTVFSKYNILCTIDELETSLHPDLMKHFILTFLTNAKQSQLIVTTHNISFLENQDILRKDVIKFTEKKEDGSTELYALSDFDPAIFRKNPSFLTAYKIGKLGAKPNLGDYYLEVENEQK